MILSRYTTCIRRDNKYIVIVHLDSHTTNDDYRSQYVSLSLFSPCIRVYTHTMMYPRSLPDLPIVWNFRGTFSRQLNDNFIDSTASLCVTLETSPVLWIISIRISVSFPSTVDYFHETDSTVYVFNVTFTVAYVTFHKNVLVLWTNMLLSARCYGVFPVVLRSGFHRNEKIFMYTYIYVRIDLF